MWTGKSFEKLRTQELTDVANAILEGSDYLLLAEETAVEKHLLLSINIMKK
ncbi:MAG: hypothetical protein ABIJ14_02325 [Nanoarchaeota archaeon]